MKGIKLPRIVISLSVLCLMAIHCGDPFLPRINIISPTQNAVIVQSAVPYSLPLEVRVPRPSCGATTYPIDPSTFGATLVGLRDGEEISEIDVTGSFGVPTVDPETGEYTWNGSVELSAFGDYRLDFTISNERGAGYKSVNLRLEQTVAAFPGGTFTMSVSSLKQNPANCLVADFLLGIIYGLISGQTFPLTLPSGQAILDNGNTYPLTITLPYPLGNIDVILSLDETNNDILIDGPDSYTIDLTGMVPPPFTGFDCVITASADGVFNDMDPNDLDGLLTIGIIDIDPSSGGSGCTLNPPSGDCDLIAGMDAD